MPFGDSTNLASLVSPYALSLIWHHKPEFSMKSSKLLTPIILALRYYFTSFRNVASNKTSPYQLIVMLESGVSGPHALQFVMEGPKEEIGLNHFSYIDFYSFGFRTKLADAKNEGEACVDNLLRVLSLIEASRCNEHNCPG